MRHKLLWAMIGCMGWFLTACHTTNAPAKLPILGERDVKNGDTVYHTIPDFSFINQDSQVVTNATFANKIYIVDFFFTSCPTICPKVTRQLLRVQERYKQDDRVRIVAHTIDPKRDTPARLRTFAQQLNVSTPQWHFLTGDKEAIYEIADDYFSIAIEDEDAPGGFDHSGRLILVDANRHIRAFCDGTDEADVTKFMGAIEQLLTEIPK